MSPELLSPAGSSDAALAAFQYGADAIYLGLPLFSARADADNITAERLRVLLAYARTFSPAKKIFVTFNTLVQDAELPEALNLLDTLNDLSPDGLIVQDLGLSRLIRENFPRLALHASTQLAAHNLDGVLALKTLGFSRVVLARELTLDEIRHIVRESGVEIEIFVHGALCYSMSGLCLFSSHTAGRSGNRGRCAYCCRESFTCAAGSDSTPSGERCYPFSMKDLALAPILDRVVATGVHSLKIEGRMKSPLYVACVTDYYRRKIDGHLTLETERELIQDLQTVFSRPWTSLYAEGPGATPDTIIDPVAIGHRGAPIGTADAVFRDRSGIRWLRFTTNRALEKHDGLQVELPGGGKPFGCAVNVLRAAGSIKPVISLPRGATVEVALPEENVPVIPPGSPVFCSASQAIRRRYEIQNIRESALPLGRAADIHVSLDPGGIRVRAASSFEGDGVASAECRLPLSLTPSRQPEKTLPAVRKAFERLGDTAWRLGTLAVDDPCSLYAPPSKLNESRRIALDALTHEWNARRAAHRTAVSAFWGLQPPNTPPHTGAAPFDPSSVMWSLKIRADAALLPADALAGIGTLTLAIGHIPLALLEEQLASWKSLFSTDRILLALPLVTRVHEHSELKNTAGTLIKNGWTQWECADLAGHRLLADLGTDALSADWSLYALNRISAAELFRLGARSFVLSPENDLANIRALCRVCVSHPYSPPRAQPELLVYQHTPLFISETEPCQPHDGKQLTFCDRRGRTFVTRKLDGRWITVWQQAFCMADHIREAGCGKCRIDLSYSPASESHASIIRTVCSGYRPAGTHTGNLERGLL